MTFKDWSRLNQAEDRVKELTERNEKLNAILKEETDGGATLGWMAIRDGLESQLASLTEENERLTKELEYAKAFVGDPYHFTEMVRELASERARADRNRDETLSTIKDLAEAEQRAQEAWKVVKENQARYSTLLNEQTQRAIEANKVIEAVRTIRVIGFKPGQAIVDTGGWNAVAESLAALDALREGE